MVGAEKGKNHTVIVRGSASGFVLPPMIIFPRVHVRLSRPTLLLVAILQHKRRVGLPKSST